MRSSAPWQIIPDDFFDAPDQLRRAVARLAHCSAQDIAIVPSVSYAIATAAANLPASRNQEILLLEEQFPSNVYPWQALAAATGAEIKIIARPPDSDWTRTVLSTLSERTAIAALPHAHWTDGSRLDLEAIGVRCRELGCALVLDLTQSLGAAPFYIDRIKPDFMVAAGYKWLFGPYGVSYLYVAPHHHEGTALEQTWMGRAGSEDFASLVNYRDSYRPGARRFDAGEPSSFLALPMALAALEQLLNWGPQQTTATLQSLTDLIAARARALGLEVTPEAARSPHLLAISYPQAVPPGLLENLNAQGVYVSVRGRRLRIAPHLHINDQDLDRFFAVLESYAP